METFEGGCSRVTRNPTVGERGLTPAWMLCTVLCLVVATQPAAAVELGPVQGFDISLDTALRASLGLRLARTDGALLGDANADDGNRAFRRGPMSQRVDFNSQLDVSRGDFGLTIGVDGWYDRAYQTASANRSLASFNPDSVGSSGFPGDSRRLMGGTVELGSAYIRDKFEIGGLPVTVRVGRQTLLWGESLFFPQDGIAAGQSPVDELKELSQPLVEGKETFLPVAQADIRITLPLGFSIEAYYQFEWRRNRTPGVGSFFSTSDILDAGGQRAFLPGGATLARGRDDTPPGPGQFGIALRRSSGLIDVGVYAMRYDAKSPQIGLVEPGAREYRAVFPRGIKLLGVSASSYIGEDTLAAEVSGRWNMPLVSRGLASVPFGGFFGPVLPPAAEARAGYATGQTLHALVSYERQIPPGSLWDSATLAMELAATSLTRVETHPERRQDGTTSLATALEVVFTPRYFQVRPGLDLAPQIGLQWGLSGRSSVDSGMVKDTGYVTIGLAATYRSVWEATVAFTHFIGPPRDQALADRDFLIFSVSRTF